MTTNQHTKRPSARISARISIAVCVAGLVAAAVGVLLQYLASPTDFPTVPPGPIVLTGGAAFVATAGRWWWSPLVGVAVALMVLIGGSLSGGLLDNLSATPVLKFGAALMLAGLGLAIVAGLIASLSLRTRTNPQ